MRPGQEATEGERKARELMEKLEIKPEDLIAGAYLDMIVKR